MSSVTARLENERSDELDEADAAAVRPLSGEGQVVPPPTRSLPRIHGKCYDGSFSCQTDVLSVASSVASTAPSASTDVHEDTLFPDPDMIVLVVADVMSFIAFLFFLSVGMGTHYWYRTSTRKGGPFTQCDAKVLPVFLTLLFVGVALTVVAIFLLTFAIRARWSIPCRAIAAGVSLVIGGLAICLALSLYGTGYAKISTFHILTSGQYGWSFRVAAASLVFMFIAGIMAIVVGANKGRSASKVSGLSIGEV